VDGFKQLFKAFLKKEIFRIITQTHTGKCWLMTGKDCKFFDELTAKALGFFNMTYGAKKGLNVDQTKMAFSTFLFRDISVKTCKIRRFDERALLLRIRAIHREHQR